MSRNLISALIVALLLAVWLGSGLLSGDSASVEHPPLAAQQPAPPVGAPGGEIGRAHV